jgi:hypothetical protein
MYKWTKVWAIQVDMEDTVQPGDIIKVGASTGASEQLVLSVTVMRNQKGGEYKTCLLQAVKA